MKGAQQAGGQHRGEDEQPGGRVRVPAGQEDPHSSATEHCLHRVSTTRTRYV